MAVVNIHDIPVHFPFEPYDVQKNYMEKVIECLETKRHGLLESPTGTGKTLSLLCSTLAWLTSKVEEQEKKNETENDHSSLSVRDINKINSGKEHEDGKNARPTIFYSSRTHTQLTQAVNELKRSHYNYVNAAVLGSRDQLCIHPEVSKETNRGAQVSKCRNAVKRRACVYHQNVEFQRCNPLFQDEILDIEDLVAHGRQLSTCPYYMSRALRTTADIVFLPYQYLLDFSTRRRMELKLENSIIILDEGHNVEKLCEDSASFQLCNTELAGCVEELSQMIEAFHVLQQNSPDGLGFTEHDLNSIRKILRELDLSIFYIRLARDDTAKFDGAYIFELFDKVGVNRSNAASLVNLMSGITNWISMNDSTNIQHLGTTLEGFMSFLSLLFEVKNGLFVEHAQTVSESYKVFVTLEKRDQSYIDSWIKRQESDKNDRVGAKIVNFWCFNPAFGMRTLLDQNVHSIIITSGTLSPLQPIIFELGIPTAVTLENPHVISHDQVFVGVLTSGPGGQVLNSSYKTRNDLDYILALGRSIRNAAKLIPHGLLVFFPSYAVMANCAKVWRSNTVWAEICNTKEVFIEPRTKDELRDVMQSYYKKVAEPGSKGACFFAVCRGKVSEGLDFIDHNGRGVIITGLPYPPCYDPRVVLKKEYLEKSNKRLSSRQWYQLEATRAVNQSIGRVIRHKNDYGVILFFDSRFCDMGIRNDLSRWLRNRVTVQSNFGMLPRPLALFFQNAKANLPQPEIKPYTLKRIDTEDDMCFSRLLPPKPRTSSNNAEDDDIVITYAAPLLSEESGYASGSNYSRQENVRQARNMWRNKKRGSMKRYPFSKRYRTETVTSDTSEALSKETPTQSLDGASFESAMSDTAYGVMDVTGPLLETSVSSNVSLSFDDVPCQPFSDPLMEIQGCVEDTSSILDLPTDKISQATSAGRFSSCVVIDLEADEETTSQNNLASSLASSTSTSTVAAERPSRKNVVTIAYE